MEFQVQLGNQKDVIGLLKEENKQLKEMIYCQTSPSQQSDFTAHLHSQSQATRPDYKQEETIENQYLQSYPKKEEIRPHDIGKSSSPTFITFEPNGTASTKIVASDKAKPESLNQTMDQTRDFDKSLLEFKVDQFFKKDPEMR